MSVQDIHKCSRQCGNGPEGAPSDHRSVGAPQGWRLGGIYAAVFLVPVALAIAGTALAGRTTAGQFLGAVVGLAVGLIATSVVAKLVRRKGKELT